MKTSILILLSFFIITVAGCAGKDEASQNITNGLEVTVTSNPSAAKLLEPVKVLATVKRGGVKVGEEAEVEFELIKKDGSPIGTVRPERIGEGEYQIETIFDEEGIYQIVSHVTFGAEHEMPIHEITVSP